MMRGLTIAVFLAIILVVSSFHEEDKAVNILKKILHAIYPDNHHDDHEHQDHDDQEQHDHHNNHDHLDHDYDHHDDCDHDYDHHGDHHEDHYPDNSANYNPNHPLSNVRKPPMSAPVKESPAPVSGQTHPQPGYGETPSSPLGVAKGMLGGGHYVAPVKEPLHPVHGHVGVINMPLEVTTGMARGNVSHEKIVYHH